VPTFLDKLPPACDVLRDYQIAQLDAIAHAIHSGHRRIITQLPTGAGKTHEISGAVAAACHAGLRVLILATRTRLVRQLHERLDAFGVAHGVVAAELPRLLDHFQLVQVASADTLYRRCVVDDRMSIPAAELVIFDEAHLAAADSRLKLLQQYPGALLLGFTATPARKSGRSLSAIFDHLILGPSIPSLIAAGMLVRMRTFSVPVMTERQLAELPSDTSNDYQANAAAELMSRPKLIGDVLDNWLRIANGKRTLLFACTKAHGAQLVEQFLRAGIAAELLTDQDDDDAREKAVARLEMGQTTVIVNCFLMSYGVDIPSVECIVLARPTRSVVLYLQMVGRGMRPALGKDYCILIDHGRVVEKLGLPTVDFGWSLDDRRNVNREAREAQARIPVSEQPRTCPECNYTWLVSEEGSACAHCGWAPAPTAKPVRCADADLMELEPANDPPNLTPNHPAVVQFFRECLGDYVRRKPQVWREKPNTARAASWHATADKFKFDRNIPSAYWSMCPLPPSTAAVGWMRYRRIKFSRSRG
jgi:superfamily II DNA or RNA helicase